ncbi:MAG TPA: cytochrome c peroxidase [Gammaproteobacteria bacterium]|nr:cytochrome c peroxidase [Gammaproteobacteria bacterium]
MSKRPRFVLALALVASLRLQAELPPVPVPVENPITEPKRVLGKILFWDEQLSSDGSVACGTCHRPGAGGGDPRSGRHPGIDKGTIDDVLGSPGIVALDHDGKPRPNALFGAGPQITPRLSPANFTALWADALFWDGRAGPELEDPLTGKVAIARGGALENQALAALLNDTEMAKAGRTWADVAADLARSRPLALAAELPPDTAAAIERHPTYPALFAAAFGDAAITPLRIAFALATYQRTLVADQTPWDRFAAGDTTALSGRALYGWRALQSFHCTACHTPPLVTNNEFFQIGVRRADFDRGRQNVTHDPEDAGEMKVPSLRNAALRPRFMHTGEFASLGAAIRFYINTLALPERDGIPGAGLYTFNMSGIDEADLREFITAALTDPRVRDERFPFDRPVLRSERAGDVAQP